MLKADFHIHTSVDPHDRITYSPRELIDYAASLEYDVLAITHHNHVYDDPKTTAYAKKKGILLIPGAEKMIEGKEVLVYGIDHDQMKKIKTYEDLKNVPLVIAPHPFFKRSQCLESKLIENQQYFHGIEYSHFYTRYFNLNKKAVKIANQLDIPMVGNSDCHHLPHFNTTYSLVDAKKDQKSIFEAIKNNRVQVVTRPMTTPEFMWRFKRIMRSIIKKRLRI